LNLNLLCFIHQSHSICLRWYRKCWSYLRSLVLTLWWIDTYSFVWALNLIIYSLSNRLTAVINTEKITRTCITLWTKAQIDICICICNYCVALFNITCNVLIAYKGCSYSKIYSCVRKRQKVNINIVTWFGYRRGTYDVIADSVWSKGTLRLKCRLAFRWNCYLLWCATYWCRKWTSKIISLLAFNLVWAEAIQWIC